MSYISHTARRQFLQEGFLLIPDVYASDDLSFARQRLTEAFVHKKFHRSRFDNDHILTDIYQYFPELAPIVFNEKFKTIARDLLGENAVLIPECAVHRERFFDWHTDTTVQELAGVTSHAAQNAKPIIQFATYFQDNTENGGGLTVIPRTHILPDPFLELYSPAITHKIKNRLLKLTGLSVFDQLEKHPEKLDIPVKTGDLLVFDVRLYHRATFRKHKDPIEKLAIFNTVIADDEAGMAYFHFMKKRPETYYQYFREEPLNPVLEAHLHQVNMNFIY